MVEITKELIEIAYKEANENYKIENGMNDISIQKAINNMINAGWNKTGAKWTMPIFNALMNGECYYRTMSKLQTETFLNNILNDYGMDNLKQALKSVEKHLEYYKTKYKKEMPGIQEIYNKFLLKTIRTW